MRNPVLCIRIPDYMVLLDLCYCIVELVEKLIQRQQCLIRYASLFLEIGKS
jgi:hypothetical protein